MVDPFKGINFLKVKMPCKTFLTKLKKGIYYERRGYTLTQKERTAIIENALRNAVRVFSVRFYL